MIIGGEQLQATRAIAVCLFLLQIGANPVVSAALGSDKCKPDPEGERRFKAELAQFKPPRFEEPRILAAFLPPSAKKGNAAPIILAALKRTLAKGGSRLIAKEDWAGDPAVDSELKAVESALLYDEYSVVGTLIIPNTEAQLWAANRIAELIGKYGRVFQSRGQSYLKAGKIDLATVEFQKAATLGFLMMHDWSNKSQSQGGRLARDGILGFGLARKERHLCTFWTDGPKMIDEMQAYNKTPEELTAVLGLGKDPATVGELGRYLDDPVLRSRFADFVFLSASQQSQPESAANRLDPRRSEFLRRAMAHPDERVAALARGNAAAIAEGLKGRGLDHRDTLSLVLGLLP